jgi:hypothetical protein
VQDGRPFCPQCRAPQIHVQVASAETEIAAGATHFAAESSTRFTQTGNSDLLNICGRDTKRESAIDRSAAIRAAVKAGMLGVFIGMIPLLGILLTGALAVYLYRRENGSTLPAALASRLGGAAGVVAFAINAVLITIQIFIFHAQQKYSDDIMAIAQRFGGKLTDPDLQASIHNLFTPAGLAVTLFFGMILSVVLASVGGALASLFLRPGNPPG